MKMHYQIKIAPSRVFTDLKYFLSIIPLFPLLKITPFSLIKNSIESSIAFYKSISMNISQEALIPLKTSLK
jgi:hypothetical protein